MKIRKDLVGVVFVATENGSPIMLKAGDEVPEGVTVGDHLTVDDEPITTPDDGQDDDGGQDDDDGGQNGQDDADKPEPKPKSRR